MAQRTCTTGDCDRHHYARGYCKMHYRRWQVHGDADVVLKPGTLGPRTSAVDRFYARVDIDPATGCWNWTGRKTDDGYGTFMVDNELWLTHRWSYEHHIGPIPDGLHTDHLCRNRACCNPQHLEPVTPRENGLRGISPAAHNARKTHCKKDHPLSGDNLAYEGGRRICRTCRRAWRREYDEQRRQHR